MAHVAPSLLSSLAASKYTTVASATILVWDMALTLDQEISRVWRAKKNFGTTLFFLNRYIPPALFGFDLYSQLVSSLSMKLCKNYQISSTILDLVCMAVIECVLIMRTSALYNSKGLFIFLVILGIISIVNMIICFLAVFRYETFVPASTISMSGCLSGCTSAVCQPLLIVFWVPFFCLETAVLGLTAWKTFRTCRQMKSVGGSAVLKVVLRDGILYYIVIMGISASNILIWSLLPFAPYLTIGLLKSLQVTICSRLMLNMRGLLKTTRGSRFESATLFDLDSIGPSRNPSGGSELDAWER